jgi:hypothetical protein
LFGRDAEVVAVDVHAFENSMIHFIRPEELAVAVHRHDSRISLPLVGICATSPIRNACTPVA